MFDKYKLFFGNKYNFYVDNLSKKFKLDLKYFLKSGIWSIFNLITIFILSLILTYFIANYLTQENIGKYYFIFSIAAIFGIFTFTGLIPTITNNFLNKEFESYISHTNFRIKISLIGSFLLIILAIISKFILNQNLWYYLVLIAIYIPTLNFNIYNRYLFSKNKFKEIALISIIKNLIQIIPTIYLIYNSYTLIIIIGYYLLIQNLFDFIIYLKFKPKKLKNIEIKKSEIKNSLIFSIKDSISIVSLYIDKFILPIFFDLKVLAIYAISLIIPKSINSMFDKLYFFLFYKKLNKNKIKFRNYKFLTFMLLNIVLTLILINILPFIFEVMYPKYLKYVFYSQLLIGLLPLNLLNILFLKYFESRNLAKEILNINIIIQIIQITLYFILIPLFSIIGAIIVKYIKDLCITILSLYYINKN